MREQNSNGLLMLYYDATLVFLLLDWLLGVNVRLAFLEGWPEWRAGYYAFCIACAAAMHLLPDFRVLIAAVEGLFTMLGLILGMYTGYMLMNASNTGDYFQVLANYSISGFFAYLSWQRGMAQLGSKLKSLI